MKAPAGPRQAQPDDRLRAGLAPDVPAIHVWLDIDQRKTWMPGIKPGMTIMTDWAEQDAEAA
jgi:hypothetical protein